ncbi:MAG: glycerophosphodiester phosphodiesterase [Gammaproteobacteria bacterium]|nr:glycerophosphodiester phosphodiesterase [Gammaproteobacteria bacterium]
MTTHSKRLPIIAHRGNAWDYPENSLASLASAIELGCGFVEFDVQLSADGVPLVIHDADLQRTAGDERAVLTAQASTLREVSVHEPARFGDRHQPTPLPRLADVVDLLMRTPDVTALVELKRASIARHGIEAMLAATLPVLERMRTQAVIISFNHALVAAAMQRGWRGGMVLETYDEIGAIAAGMPPELVICNLRKLPAGDAPLPQGPWRWAAYEVTTAQEVENLHARGVSLLETMQVRAIRSVLERVTWMSMS